MGQQSWQAAITRRQFIRAGGLLALGTAVSACTRGTAAQPNGTAAAASASGPRATALDISTDFDYAGTPGGFARWWTAVVRKFADENGVELNATNVPYTDLQPRMQAAFSARQGPALLPWYGNIHSYQYLDQGVLEPLGPWVGGSSEVDHWRFKGFPLGGEFYMSPIYIELFLLTANRDNLEKAGVSVDNRIESWEALAESLERIAASGQTPIMMGTKDAFGVEQWAIPGSMAHMDTGTEWSQWLVGDLPLDAPAGVGWMDNLSQLVENGWVNDDASTLNAAEAVQRFAEGEGAFMIMFSGEALNLDPERFMIIPYWDGPGERAAQVAAAGSGLVMAAYSSDEEKRTGGDFIRYVHEPAQMKLLHDEVGVLPNDDRYEPELSNNPLMEQTYALMDSEPTPHWPTEFMPQEILFDGLMVFGPQIVSGTAVDRAKKSYQDFVTEWRANNPERVEMVRGLLEAVGTT